MAPDSDTETFIALRCEIDNWRWAGVPFFLRTGKHLAEGARIVSIAFREPPQSMFPKGSGVGTQGPDHLTFDLADASKLSLSFYGKRPGPGMKLDKLSLQFALHETEQPDDALEAYERLIHDSMAGDQTLFTNAEGIERLWEVSQPLLDDPPEVQLYRVGSWGPPAIHDLFAPGRGACRSSGAGASGGDAPGGGRGGGCPVSGDHWSGEGHVIVCGLHGVGLRTVELLTGAVCPWWWWTTPPIPAWPRSWRPGASPWSAAAPASATAWPGPVWTAPRP